MQTKSESKGRLELDEPLEPQHLTEQRESDSPTDVLGLSLAQSKDDPQAQIQMSSMQSLVTLQGNKHTNSKDSKQMKGKGGLEQLSAGEIDDFSLFQQPIEGAQHETDANNTFHEINQSVDQVCQDDPDFQSILSNRIRAAQPAREEKKRSSSSCQQTEEQKTAAQEALLQKKVEESEVGSSDADQMMYSSGRADEEGQLEDRQQSLQVAQDKMSLAKNDQHYAQQVRMPHLQLMQQHQQNFQEPQSRQQLANEQSKTARMYNSPFSCGPNGHQFQNATALHQRTSKSSTRQHKRPPIGYFLPTFSTENYQQQDSSQSSGFHQKQASQQQQQQQFEQSTNLALHHQKESQHHHQQMMQSLQQKLHINLKNLPSTSGGSSSYSNKDLSERLQGIIRQRNQGHQTTGVSPTLKPGSQIAWPHEGLDMGLIDSSNRTRTERDDPVAMFQNSHGVSGQGQQSSLHAVLAGNTGSSNMPPMPANLSQDPYVYLQWRQQKHKSCRSAHPNHQASYLLHQRKAASPGANARTLRLVQGKGGRHQKGGTNGIGGGQVNDSTSSFSNSSQTTVPVKSLTEVKNPSNLITFRFVNRKVTHLNEIGRFRNLTELDVNGNLLQQSVPELLNLPFLKKLNLSGNQITEMWSLPKTLEILNIGYNCLKKLDIAVMRSLSNLTTLEISNNGIESLEGLESVTRLKRLIARNNYIQNLEPIFNLKLLIEMDLENNPIDSASQVLQAVQNKKDILLLNLKLAPLMVKIQNYDEFIASVSEDSKIVQEFKQLLTFLHNGTFYRRRKIYLKIRQQQQSLHIMERRFSNFSNDVDSSNGIIATQHNNQSGGGAFSRVQKNLSGSGSRTNPYRRANDKLPAPISKNQRTNSTGLGQVQGVRPGSSNPQRSQRYEAIISLYDKLLEDEDKLLLQKKRKEARERKLQKQREREGGEGRPAGADAGERYTAGNMFEDDDDLIEDDLDASLDLDDDEDDDLDDDLLSDELYRDNQSYDGIEGGEHGVRRDYIGRMAADDLDDLQTYHNQHFGVELNASTADFNKEIKQINQQLMNEGHLDAANSSVDHESQSSAQKKPVNAKQSISVKNRQYQAPQVTQVDSPAIHSQLEDKSFKSSSSAASEVKSSARHRQSNSQKKSKQGGSVADDQITLNLQESSAYSDHQIDVQEINVVVPMEERSSRYTNRQHHNNANLNASGHKQSQAGYGNELESSVIRQPIFEQQVSQELAPSALGATDHSNQPASQSSSQNAVSRANHGDAGSYHVTKVKKTPQLSFKLDLAKIKNIAANSGQSANITVLTNQAQLEQKAINTTNQGAIKKSQIADVNVLDKHSLPTKVPKNGGVRVGTPGESVREKLNHNQLISVRKIQNQIQPAQISERIPIKKNQNKSPQAAGKTQLNQSGIDLETSYQSAKIVIKKQQIPLQQKQVHIPKLALQNIHRLSSEQSQPNNAPSQQNVQPKSLKVLTLSKREDSATSRDQAPLNLSLNVKNQKSLTIKQSQIVKTLQGKKLLELQKKVDHQQKIIDEVKSILGDPLMADNCIASRILALQEVQRSKPPQK